MTIEQNHDVLEILYKRLSPACQVAMADFLSHHPPESWTAQQACGLYDHWIKSADDYTNHLIDQDETAKDQAAIMEYQGEIPRWTAEDVAFGRCCLADDCYDDPSTDGTLQE